MSQGTTGLRDGQVELEYTCVCCHRNTYPKRLTLGYCAACCADMEPTPEELADWAWKDDADDFEDDGWEL